MISVHEIFLQYTEAAVHRSSKLVFLNISQISQENTCAGVLFNKVAVVRPATLLMKDSTTDVFL